MQKLQLGVQDDVQDVHDVLNQVKMLDELITAKIAERDQLWTMATKTTQGMDGMPHGGGVSDKVGNIAVKLTALAEETDQLVDKCVDYKARVIRALETLPVNEYAVLHRYYIRYMTLVDIAVDMNYSYMQIWRIKNNGLKLLKETGIVKDIMHLC